MSTSIDSPLTPTTPSWARACESHSMSIIVATVTIWAPVVAGFKLTEIGAEDGHGEEEADVDDEQEPWLEEETGQHDDEAVDAPGHAVRPDGDGDRRGDAQPEERRDEDPRGTAQPRAQQLKPSYGAGSVARAPRDEALVVGHGPPYRR